MIYLPDPTVGARGIYHHIVTALGGRPSFHNAALVPQARDALAAEARRTGPHPRRGRRHYRPQIKPYTPFVLRDFGLVAWLFTNRVRDVRHVRTEEAVWHDQW